MVQDAGILFTIGAIVAVAMLIYFLVLAAYALFGWTPPESMTSLWPFWPPRWLVGIALIVTAFIFAAVFLDLPFFDPFPG